MIDVSMQTTINQILTSRKVVKLYYKKSYLKNQLKTKTYIDIARENEVSRQTIQRATHRFKLTNPSYSWSNNELNQLVNNYSTNRNIYGLFPQRTAHAINHKASRLKLKRLQRAGKYLFNENFFNKWSIETAYVLGLIFSDGNVSKEKDHFSIHISDKDVELLELINKLTKSNHPIEIRDHSAYLRIYNKFATAKLIGYGCIPRKSLILEFPNVPFKYLNHFVRGYFDGDGSIYFNKPDVIKIKIIGTKKFLNKLQNILFLKLHLKKHRIIQNGNIFFFEYYGNDARDFCLWLYKNNKNLYLKRKRKRFKEHLWLRGIKWK